MGAYLNEQELAFLWLCKIYVSFWVKYAHMDQLGELKMLDMLLDLSWILVNVT